MRSATATVGLVSPRSTCESIGALTPGALGEVAQRESLGLAQRAHAGAQRGSVGRRGHAWPYVITYKRLLCPLVSGMA